MPPGHLGVLAAITAFREGRPWLRELLVHLDRNRRLLAALLVAGSPPAQAVTARQVG